MAKLWTVLALVLAQGMPPLRDALVLEAVPGHAGFLGANLPPLPPALSARVLQYAQARSAALRDVSEGGRLVLVATQFGSSPQLHRLSQPLGMREQLTFFEAPVGRAAFLPGDSSTLLFLQEGARKGGALQLFRLDLRTGRTELLTDGTSHHETFVLSPDGRWLAYSSTRRTGLDSDVYLAEVADAHAARRLTALQGRWLPLEFSPDGSQLLVAEGPDGEAGRLWLLDIARGARRLLVTGPEGSRAGVRAARFSADGRAVYLLLDGTDFTTLRRLPLDPPQAVPEAVVADVPAEVEEVAVSTDGTLVFSTNEAGYSRAYLVRGRRAEALPLPEGVLHDLRFAPGKGEVLFFSLESPTSPADVWAFSLKTRKLVRWTKSEVGGVDTRRLVAPKLVRYVTKDGLSLSAFLYLPSEVPVGTQVPVVLALHDGPSAQERPVFRWDYQLLLEHGLAVLAPNLRGSTGFGKAFGALDDGVLRELTLLQDIPATLAMLARQPGVDASRLAAWGHGYGGYLALTAAALYPTAFRAVADEGGPWQLSSFVETAPPYRREALRAEYGDERRPEVRAVLERLSPLAAVERMPASLLLVQAKQDARLPATQAQQLIHTRGRADWYLLAVDEGPALNGEEARALLATTLSLFLEEKLRAPTSAAVP